MPALYLITFVFSSCDWNFLASKYEGNVPSLINSSILALETPSI